MIKGSTGDIKEFLTVPDDFSTVLGVPCVLGSVGTWPSEIASMDSRSTTKSPKASCSVAFFRTDRTSGMATLRVNSREKYTVILPHLAKTTTIRPLNQCIHYGKGTIVTRTVPYAGLAKTKQTFL